MDRLNVAVSHRWGILLLMTVCCALPISAAHAQAAPQAGTANPSQAADEAAVKAELRRTVEQRKRELRPEYERRVREDGKPSADRWLREAAAEMGRRDGAAMRARYGE